MLNAIVGCGRGGAECLCASLAEVSSLFPSFQLEIAILDDVTLPELTVLFAIRIGTRSIINRRLLMHSLTSLKMSLLKVEVSLRMNWC